MMKKLLLLITGLIGFNFSGTAQMDTCQVVNDTIHYYFNKYYFKKGTTLTTYTQFPHYKAAASTVTAVTHVGSRFENKDTSLMITGLEAYASKQNFGSTKLRVHLFLCTLNVNNMPVLPAIDSIVTDIGANAVNTPTIIGGNFKTPHRIRGDYAVLIRNMQTISGDTVYLLRTDAHSVNNQWSFDSKNKYSDSYGYARFGGQFYSTKDFTVTGFGHGTDYEFMVAPRVQYCLLAKQVMDQKIIDFNNAVIDTICTRTPFTFKNESSYQFTNRFYNLIEFYRKWNLYGSFAAQPHPNGFSADSAIVWNFEFYETHVPTIQDPRVILPYEGTNINHGSITATTGEPGCFTANQFRASLRPMSAFGRVPQMQFSETFTVCLKFCNDANGITPVSGDESVKVFPNPLVSGKTTVSGLRGQTTIKVYNLLGEVILTSVTSGESADINISEQPKGAYLVRITNGEDVNKVVRIIKQN